MGRRLTAEALGTFWLVFAGCGSALLSAGMPSLGIGVVGIALSTSIVYAVSFVLLLLLTRRRLRALSV